MFASVVGGPTVEGVHVRSLWVSFKYICRLNSNVIPVIKRFNVPLIPVVIGSRLLSWYTLNH